MHIRQAHAAISTTSTTTPHTTLHLPPPPPPHSNSPHLLLPPTTTTTTATTTRTHTTTTLTTTSHRPPFFHHNHQSPYHTTRHHLLPIGIAVGVAIKEEHTALAAFFRRLLVVQLSGPNGGLSSGHAGYCSGITRVGPLVGGGRRARTVAGLRAMGNVCVHPIIRRCGASPLAPPLTRSPTAPVCVCWAVRCKRTRGQCRARLCFRVGSVAHVPRRVASL